MISKSSKNCCLELRLENRPELGEFQRKVVTEPSLANPYHLLKPLAAVSKKNEMMHRYKSRKVHKHFTKILPPPVRPPPRSLRGSFAFKQSLNSFKAIAAGEKVEKITPESRRKKFFSDMFDDRQEAQMQIMASFVPEGTSKHLNEKSRMIRRPKLPKTMYNLPLIYAEPVKDELEGYYKIQEEAKNSTQSTDTLITYSLATIKAEGSIESEQYYAKNFPLILRTVPKFLKTGGKPTFSLVQLCTVLRTVIHKLSCAVRPLFRKNTHELHVPLLRNIDSVHVNTEWWFYKLSENR